MPKILFTFFLIVGLNSAQAAADNFEVLENFLQKVQTGSAQFTQEVSTTPRSTTNTDLSAPKSSQKPRLSSGVFEFSRPNRFKFVYQKPFAQTIVADGTTLWLYDEDLNQVSARKQEEVLNNTPAALLATAPNVAALQAQFKLSNEPNANDGRQWIRAEPRTQDSQIQSIRLGFKAGHPEILEIRDNFGQNSRIQFLEMKTPIDFSANHFNFTPPAGADVLRQ